MIISASRRTDIPAFYSKWFMNRINEGFVLVRNPRNYKQIRRIELKPENIDCIVFWTKNPKPMLDDLNNLAAYNYYFQFTLNAYSTDIESNVPPKNDEIIDTFKRLSDQIGKEKVIWRYDPIIITDKYTKEYHLKYFEKLASELHDYTSKCVFSFVDEYTKIRSRLMKVGYLEHSVEQKILLAQALSYIASKNNMSLESCSEGIHFDQFGIKKSRCIDSELISRISGDNIFVKKDAYQRKECGCVASIDIGTYNSCLHNCQYCYANHSEITVQSNYKNYDVNSPLLCNDLNENDQVNAKSSIDNNVTQIRFTNV